MSIKEELLLIQAESDDGILRPVEAVLWAQKNTKSDLHHELIWDDKKAGHEFRLEQVRRLIRIHIVNEVGKREMLSLTIDRINPGGGYRGLTEIMDSKPLRSVALADALAELERFKVKYEWLTELAAVWDAMKNVKSKQAKRSGSVAVRTKAKPSTEKRVSP